MTKQYHVSAINFTGNATDLVTQLHKASRAPANSDDVWMAQVAQRFRLIDGTVIRYDSADNFISDLVAADKLNAMVGN